MNFRGAVLVLALLSVCRGAVACGRGCGKIFESIFLDTDMEKAESLINASDSPCSHFYRYFIKNYHSIDIEEAIKSLVISLDSDCEMKEAAQLVYATKIDSAQNILGTKEEAAKHYREIAQKVNQNFFEKRITLFSKWEFENIKKEGENTKIIDFVKTMTKGGESSAGSGLLSLIKIGHVEAHAHIGFLKECAAEGSIDAMGVLGKMYFRGWGVGKNNIKARHYFTEGAKYRDAECLNGLGLVLQSEGNAKEAKKMFEKASELGSAEGDYNLSEMYEKEYQNQLLSDIHLYRSLKNDGYLPAVFKSAEKNWTKKKFAEAVLQFRNISLYCKKLLELEKAAIEMFKSHRNKEAFYLSLLIGDMGSITGYRNAAYVLKKRKTEIRNKEGLLLLLNRRIAETDCTDALIELGNMHYYGKGVKQDMKKAFSRYMSASVLGSAEGHYLLGWMYEHGCGTEKSYRLAKQYYGRMRRTNKSTYLLNRVVQTRLFLKVHQDALVSAGVIVAAMLAGIYLVKANAGISRAMFEGFAGSSAVKKESIGTKMESGDGEVGDGGDSDGGDNVEDGVGGDNGGKDGVADHNAEDIPGEVRDSRDNGENNIDTADI